jgi:predicted MFS family arabinose efflux permease
MALAAGTGLFLAPQIGWRWTFALAALPALLAFAARWAMPGPDRPPTTSAGGGRARELLRPGLRRPTLVLLAILLLHMTGFWCVYAELPHALQQQLGVAPAAAGGFQLAVNGVHLLADVAFGFLAAWLGRRRVFVAFCTGFAAAQVLVALWLPALVGDFTLFTVAAALMGVGAGTWSCFGALFGQHYPAALRATAAATLYSIGRGAQLLAKPAMAGLFAATGSFAPALWTAAACALGSAALILLLPGPGPTPLPNDRSAVDRLAVPMD